MNKKRENGAWRHDEMDCVACGREWVAVFPREAQELECPGCGHMNGAGFAAGIYDRSSGPELARLLDETLPDLRAAVPNPGAGVFDLLAAVRRRLLVP